MFTNVGCPKCCAAWKEKVQKNHFFVNTFLWDYEWDCIFSSIRMLGRAPTLDGTSRSELLSHVFCSGKGRLTRCKKETACETHIRICSFPTTVPANHCFIQLIWSSNPSLVLFFPAVENEVLTIDSKLTGGWKDHHCHHLHYDPVR